MFWFSLFSRQFELVIVSNAHATGGVAVATAGALAVRVRRVGSGRRQEGFAEAHTRAARIGTHRCGICTWVLLEPSEISLFKSSRVCECDIEVCSISRGYKQ